MKLYSVYVCLYAHCYTVTQLCTAILITNDAFTYVFIVNLGYRIRCRYKICPVAYQRMIYPRYRILTIAS